ncbi:MAG: sigma-70 family RNA polymerase sigma factor [Clostridia bacterium]|nr:sigma-70 family RNA polymerase sigma factor [Clostridia bacterium]
MKKLKQLKDYYKNNEIDMDKIIEDFTPYITTIINNGTDNAISFEDKEEIFSDTFFLLWKNKNRLHIKVSLNSYLAGITRNLIKEKYRKSRIYYDITDFENNTFNHVNMYENDRELIFDIEQKIKRLKGIDIEIVNLFYYSGISIKDIAKRLNISELNVKTRLHRVRKKIKKELNDGGI